MPYISSKGDIYDFDEVGYLLKIVNGSFTTNQDFDIIDDINEYNFQPFDELILKWEKICIRN